VGLVFFTFITAAATVNPSSAVDPTIWLRALEISPAIAALLAVIYWLIRLIFNKDKAMHALVIANQSDIERGSKILTLLEMLVQRQNGRTKGG
jgi:hypothetical protein